MRNIFTILVIFAIINFAAAQSGISILINLPDTQLVQTVYVEASETGFWLCGSALTTSPTTSELGNNLDIFSFNNAGEFKAKKTIESIDNAIIPQFLSQQPIVAHENALFLANLVKTNDYDGYSTVRKIDTLCEEEWMQSINLNKGFFGDLIVFDSKTKVVSQIGLTSPNSFTGSWPGIIYNFNTAGVLMDSLIFLLPQSSIDLEYEKIQKVKKIKNYFLILTDWIEFIGTNVSKGNTLSCVDGNGQSVWSKIFKQPFTPITFEVDTVNNKVITISYSLNYFDSITVCLNSYDIQGNDLGKICYSDVSTQTPFSGSVGNSFVDSDNNLYFNCFKYIAGKPFTSIVKINSSGVKVWEKYIKESSVGDDFIEYIVGGVAKKNGNILLCGGVGDPVNGSQFKSKQKYWVFELDSNGCFGNDCSDTIKLNSKTLTNLEELTNPIQSLNKLIIFPNPVDNWLNIKSDKVIDEIAQFEIFDITGKLVLNKTALHNQVTTISVNELTSGLYFFKMSLKNSSQIKMAKFSKF
jgi:Secretion system C-terminal sorting domain